MIAQSVLVSSSKCNTWRLPVVLQTRPGGSRRLVEKLRPPRLTERRLGPVPVKEDGRESEQQPLEPQGPSRSQDEEETADARDPDVIVLVHKDGEEGNVWDKGEEFVEGQVVWEDSEEPKDVLVELDPSVVVLEGAQPMNFFGRLRNPTLEDELRPYMTLAILVSMWAVAVWQWWPVLPGLLSALIRGDWGPLLASIWVSPETAATLSLRMDAFAVLGGQLTSLFTSSWLFSGLLSLAVCSDGFYEVGVFVEPLMGRMQILTSFLICAFTTSFTQMWVAEKAYAISGPGTMVGMYATMAVLSLRTGLFPVTTDAGLMYCLICTALAWYDPGIGLWAIAGGLLGGVVAGCFGGVLSRGVRLALVLPLGVVFFVMDQVVYIIKFLVMLVVQFCMATWRAITEVIKTIRGL